MLRPDEWLIENEVETGRAVPLVFEELEFSGLAMVKAVEACLLIAGMPLTPTPSPEDPARGVKSGLGQDADDFGLGSDCSIRWHHARFFSLAHTY